MGALGVSPRCAVPAISRAWRIIRSGCSGLCPLRRLFLFTEQVFQLAPRFVRAAHGAPCSRGGRSSPRSSAEGLGQFGAGLLGRGISRLGQAKTRLEVIAEIAGL